MRSVLLLTVFAILLTTSAAVADPIEATLDGHAIFTQSIQLPPKTEMDDNGRTVDIVGSAANPGSGTGRAKGNAYRVDIDVTLDGVEFWLDFTSTQTLSYYVFESPIEFGTYSEIYRDTEIVTGTGAAWYSAGTVAVPLYAGMHYIIAVSWDGFMTYYYDIGDSQDTSFGAHVHGYAVGFHPLPASFNSSSNDQAIYYQRLMTTAMTPVEQSTWGAVKALFR